MKIKEAFKKIYSNRNLFIAICVAILTISSIGISYSAFFTIKSNTNNQTITTGTLAVSYTGEYIDESKFNTNDLLPLPDQEGLSQNQSKIIHIQNTGTLDSEFVLTVGYDVAKFTNRYNYNQGTDRLTPIELIKLAVFEYDTGTMKSTLIAGPLSIADLPIYNLNNNGDNSLNRYAILFGTVGSNTSGKATKNYQVKAWLSDKATSSVSNTYFYLNSEIEAVVEGAERDYTINGTLKNGDNPVSEATISLQNGSVIDTTDANGEFTLSNIPAGTYNLDIKTNDKTYSGNLTIQVGNSLSISQMTSTMITCKNIYNCAYTNGTTISKFLEKNSSIKGLTDEISLSDGTTYSIPNSYVINTNTKDISNLKIVLNGDSYTMAF